MASRQGSSVLHRHRRQQRHMKTQNTVSVHQVLSQRLMDNSPANQLAVSQVADYSQLAVRNLLKITERLYVNMYTQPIRNANTKRHRLLKVLKWCNLREITFSVII